MLVVYVLKCIVPQWIKKVFGIAGLLMVKIIISFFLKNITVSLVWMLF